MTPFIFFRSDVINADWWFWSLWFFFLIYVAPLFFFYLHFFHKTANRNETKLEKEWKKLDQSIFDWPIDQLMNNKKICGFYGLDYYIGYWFFFLEIFIFIFLFASQSKSPNINKHKHRHRQCKCEWMPSNLNHQIVTKRKMDTPNDDSVCVCVKDDPIKKRKRKLNSMEWNVIFIIFFPSMK